MAQSIKLRIAGKEYSILAKDSETEHYMRVAAQNINSMLDSYDRKFPDTPAFDKLVFVTLNETVSMLAARHSLEVMSSEEGRLEKDLGDYLDKLEINR